MPMKRYWVNQPSTLQTFHTLHGRNVLCDPNQQSPTGFIDIYFTEGPVIRQIIAYRALSKGWL